MQVERIIMQTGIRQGQKTGRDTDTDVGKDRFMGERMVYTSSEISEMLGISINAAHKLIREGQFESMKLGRQYYVKKKSFENWLDDPDGIVIEKKQDEYREGEKAMGANESRCYTVNEVKNMLGISRKAVYELLSRNEFSYVVAGGKYLISKNSFDSWLDHPTMEKTKSL